MSEIVEDVFSPENFNKYFREAGISRPEKGESLCIFRSPAELVESNVKEDVVDHMLHSGFGAQHGIQVLMKNCSMSYDNALKICKEMCKDLMGMDKKDVLAKPYKFIFEKMYYAKKEHVPMDPRWEAVTLKMVNLVEKKLEDNI
jgi:hypothetical protein